MKTKVLVAGLNYNQLDYIKEIKKKGYYIVGIDKNPNAPAKYLCDRFYNFGYNETEKILKACINENFNESDKIFTASLQESYLYLSLVASSLNISFPSRESVEIAINKFKLYPFLENIGVNYPETKYIFSNDELYSLYNNLEEGSSYYLKSDFSKNPNYVYRIVKGQFDINSVNWKKDRYLQKGYVLQKEFKGKEVRVNIFGNNFLAYPFAFKDKEEIKPLPDDDINKLCRLGVIETLIETTRKLKLENYLVKYDIILNKEGEYVILDIGIDPPYRMRHHYENRGLNFAKIYVEHYLEGKVNYPIKHSCRVM